MATKKYTAPKRTRTLTPEQIQALFGNSQQVAFGRPTKGLTTPKAKR